MGPIVLALQMEEHLVRDVQELWSVLYLSTLLCEHPHCTFETSFETTLRHQ